MRVFFIATLVTLSSLAALPRAAGQGRGAQRTPQLRQKPPRPWI